MKKVLLSLLVSVLTLQSINAYAETTKDGYFIQKNFVANKDIYKADTIEKDFINAWGIAIRPAGAGGHFWVTAKNVSYEYVGDVQKSPDETLRKLHTDDLKYVKLPVGGDENFATGTVFNNSDNNFVITQDIKGVEKITAPAKFLFASDGGIISAWTERKKADETFDRPVEAITVIDSSKEGSQYFGLAISHDYDTLYAADFGTKPSIKVFDGTFKPSNIQFDMPFDDNKNQQVDASEYAPFNIQALTTPEGNNRIFVTYAKTQSCPEKEIKEGVCKKDEIFVGEEDTSKEGYGRLAEFTEDGKLVKVWNDNKKLSAPWGLAFAPSNWGKYANSLLVTNFGDGTIAAYNAKSNNFIDYLKNEKNEPIKIDKIWGIIFGNGASLGDKDALYFAAGPEDETDGVFGSLRYTKVVN